MFTDETNDWLEDMEDSQLFLICASMGAEKRARHTALAFLVTKDEDRVRQGIYMAQSIARATAAAVPVPEAAPVPQCMLVLDEDFVLTYNTRYSFKAGVERKVPLPVGRYVVKLCATRGIQFKLTPIE